MPHVVCTLTAVRKAITRTASNAKAEKLGVEQRQKQEKQLEPSLAARTACLVYFPPQIGTPCTTSGVNSLTVTAEYNVHR